jgi:hypothetical protein
MIVFFMIPLPKIKISIIMSKLFMAILWCITFHCVTNAQIQDNDPILGQSILNEQMENIKEYGGRIDCTNYWNIAVAYRHLGMPNDSIYNNLLKSMEENPSKFSNLVNIFISSSEDNIKNLVFYKILGERFSTLVEMGKKKALLQSKEEIKIDNIINQEAVDSLIAIMHWDQKYRNDANFLKKEEIRVKQYILDSLNTKRLYKIYKKYGYPGKSITGDNEYKNYFCLMVEHGQNKSGEQRFWLPIIAEALKKKELDGAVFKMLLDRIHWLETNKQYFGSHYGVTMESQENIDKIRKLYGL